MPSEQECSIVLLRLHVAVITLLGSGGSLGNLGLPALLLLCRSLATLTVTFALSSLPLPLLATATFFAGEASPAASGSSPLSMAFLIFLVAF